MLCWDGSLQLLIDIKSDGESTYAAIEQELRKHPALMTLYSKGKVSTGPVTAVISGNRPLTTMQAEDKRYGFFDGRSADLASGMPSALMPLISDNWTKLFAWQGVGPMPEAERAKTPRVRRGRTRQGIPGPILGDSGPAGRGTRSALDRASPGRC
jgi:hypothetical protein